MKKVDTFWWPLRSAFWAWLSVLLCIFLFFSHYFIFWMNKNFNILASMEPKQYSMFASAPESSESWLWWRLLNIAVTLVSVVCYLCTVPTCSCHWPSPQCNDIWTLTFPSCHEIILPLLLGPFLTLPQLLCSLIPLGVFNSVGFVLDNTF